MYCDSLFGFHLQLFCSFGTCISTVYENQLKYETVKSPDTLRLLPGWPW